ncbi:hypothetical protein KAR26_00640 [Candidatus Parcubacteria bacterium]|nr:hypothetical protein [Candidatus Parcubacteria bacterium]
MKKEKKRLVVIDSNALIHRAYHALPPLTTPKGELVNAVYGFLSIFFKVVKELEPDYMAATFDLPGPTFRHKKFKDYKGKRVKAPDELYEQIPKVKSVLRDFDIPVFEKQGYEADDIIGTIAHLTKKSFDVETIILTGDMDALQLVNEQTKVYTLRKGLKDIVLYDERLVKEKYQGLTPDQLADFKGLRGDPSDNIPGVPGIGEKTAIQLIQEFDSIENLYQELDRQSEKIREKLRKLLIDNKDSALLSKELGQIKCDVSFEFDLKKCVWRGFDEEKTAETLEKFGFHSLAKRLSKEKEQTNNMTLF